MKEHVYARLLLWAVMAIALAAFLTIVLSAIDGLMSQVSFELQQVLDQPEIKATR